VLFAVLFAQMGPTIGYFTTDRAIKYGWGIPRLAVLCVLAFELAPRISSAVPAAESLGLAAYLRSGRWIAHAYIGSIGAAVNVQVHTFFPCPTQRNHVHMYVYI